MSNAALATPVSLTALAVFTTEPTWSVAESALPSLTDAAMDCTGLLSRTCLCTACLRTTTRRQDVIVHPDGFLASWLLSKFVGCICLHCTVWCGSEFGGQDRRLTAGLPTPDS